MVSLMMSDSLEDQGLAIPELTAEGENLLEGWLQKRGQKVRSLKRRYFVLTRGQLDYYEAADGDAPKGGEKLQLVHRGSFQLHNSTVVELAPSPGLAAGAAAKGGGGGFFRALRNMAGGDDGDPPNGFVVRSGTRVLACYADDAASMEAWIKAIRRNGDYEPRDAANPLPLNHGWVVKSAGPRAGGTTDTEKKIRYAVLRRGHLDYFESAADDRAKQSLVLEDARFGALDDEKKFFVTTPKGLWHFAVANAFERSAWVDKLTEAVTYSPSWVPIDKEGWLVKEGANVKTLTRRYFALRGTDLSYFEDESLGSRKGGQAIGEGTAFKEAGEDNHGFHFKVVSSGGQELLMTAPTHQVRVEWMTACKRALSATADEDRGAGEDGAPRRRSFLGGAVGAVGGAVGGVVGGAVGAVGAVGGAVRRLSIGQDKE